MSHNLRIHYLIVYLAFLPVLYRDVVMADLETAESRLDDAYATNEKEKNVRYKPTVIMFTHVYEHSMFSNPKPKG